MNTIALAQLTEQAERARNEAAQLLASERQNKQKIAAQLQTLQGYRHEYRVQLQRQLLDGLAPATIATYQQFLRSLDHAIIQAQQALQQQSTKADQVQQLWIEKQQRLQSFTTLGERQQQVLRKQVQQREQKLADELTTTMYARRLQLAKGGF